MEYYIRMSLRQWLALFLFYTVYVFLGTAIFYTMEHNTEVETRAVALQQRIDINELLLNYTSPDDADTQNYILERVSDYCGKKVTDHKLDEYVPPYVWNFYHAFYFSFTTCTTVGYGNISPSSSLGRIILCFYSLFGLPLSCFFIANVAHYFAEQYYKLYRQYNEYKHATTKNYVPPEVGFIGKIFLYLTPGLVIFIFLPAILFSHFEDWDYIESVYFAYVTLSTVGYGDRVPTFQEHQEHRFGDNLVLYEIFIIFWNIAGLGYVLMLINFIAQAMKSKRVAKLEHKLASNLRATEHLVRQEVSKDLNFLRRLLNEVNLMKVKPVYADVVSRQRFNSLPRSSSCPDLQMFHPKCTPRNLRSRSCSINTGRLWKKTSSDISTTTLNRAQSDSDLHLIDRRKTFENPANKHGNDDLLTKVVSALGSIRNYDENVRSNPELGKYGLSESQILSSENRSSRWSLARSDAEFPLSRVDRLSSFNHLTWNNTKDTNASSRPVIFNRSFSLNMPEHDQSGQNIDRKEAINRMLNKSNSPKSRIMSEQGKRNSLIYTEMGSQMNLDRMRMGRDSIVSLPRQYISATSKGRDSIISILDAPVNSNKSELLETTSIADLIRALEVAHFTSSQKEDETSNVSPILKKQLHKGASSRRGSLRPIPGYTTIFTSSDAIKPTRKISSPSNLESPFLSRHLSLRPHHPPPQYTVGPKPSTQRFGVRSTNTSPERINSPIQQPSLMFQKKLPHGPSPLARNDVAQDGIGQNKRISELIRK